MKSPCDLQAIPSPSFSLRRYTDNDFYAVQTLIANQWYSYLNESEALICAKAELSYDFSNTDRRMVLLKDGKIVGATFSHLEDFVSNHSFLEDYERICSAYPELHILKHHALLHDEGKLIEAVEEQQGVDGVAYLDLLLLSPAVHGKGQGKHLLKDVCLWMQENGAKTIRLATDDTCNVGFYHILGFTQRKKAFSTINDFRQLGSPVYVYVYEALIDDLLKKL